MIELRNNLGNRRVLIASEVFTSIEKFAGQGFPRETGGILLGRFRRSDGAPVVYSCTGPPIDSESRSMGFVRGVKELQSVLETQFVAGNQYLGEWHSHPNGQSTPSPRDRHTMFSIGHNPNYQMPRPLLLIVGGSPLAGWSLECWRSRFWLRVEGYSCTVTK